MIRTLCCRALSRDLFSDFVPCCAVMSGFVRYLFFSVFLSCKTIVNAPCYRVLPRDYNLQRSSIVPREKTRNHASLLIEQDYHVTIGLGLGLLQRLDHPHIRGRCHNHVEGCAQVLQKARVHDGSPLSVNTAHYEYSTSQSTITCQVPSSLTTTPSATTSPLFF